MQPISHHWADTTAVRIIKTKGDKEQYVVASGITPSGFVHIGNFREVLTVDLLARALKDLGVKVRFIYSWDDFDTFRKVPKNLPDPKAFEGYLFQPIARIPDPWGKASSYAAGRIEAFEQELIRVGIHPEYLYQHQLYSSGAYAEEMRRALLGRQEIKAILDQHRSEPLSENWLPTSMYCERCQCDKMEYEKFDGDWGYSYKCQSCGHEATTDIRTTKNLKLSWRTDWPMRWYMEQVDFEPGGKDHSSQGGSFDTAKEIVKKIWNFDAPIYLQYDFVMIKGGAGKMSSSSGNLYTLSEVLEVYDPQIVRWIFASHRPNHDFSIAFDEDVIKIHDEFDRAEQMALGPRPEKDGKWPLVRRTYELSTLDGCVPQRQPLRPGFRVLCNQLQICDGDIGRTLERYYQSQIRDDNDRQAFQVRAQCAKNWLEKHAPEEFKYKINSQAVNSLVMSQPQADSIVALRCLLERVDLTSIDPKDLNQMIYDDVIRGTPCEAGEFFLAVYQKLIGRDQGPRLPGFLKEIGKDRLLSLL